MTDTVSQRAATSLGLPTATVLRIARSAPYRYKVYEVAKRSGRGMRIIAQPAREVKALQRWLVESELSELPVHSAATAYAKGSSIRENAARHVRNNYLLKADFRDFFPSIKESALTAHLQRHCAGAYSQFETQFICRILLWRPDPYSELQLSIGAPSSPFVSNTIMHQFDTAISDVCERLGVSYSRYADDMAFSTRQPDVLASVGESLAQVLARINYPALALNNDKSVWTSKKHFRAVTGLVLANQGYVSLGREKKRILRAMVHRYQVGQMNPAETLKLKGLLAFAEDVEPDFVRRLEAHCSSAIIEAIRTFHVTTGD
jgi:RNA-directed DNA polymerase